MKLFFNMNKKSLPQVVKQNESDIKELQEKIKPYYTTSVDLNKDSVVVDVSDTNIDESTFVNGYLLTENGKLFNIVSVDDGIAYISFMADFKGAKGDTGLAGGELTSFYFNPNNMGITYNDGKLNINGQLTFTTASGGQTEQSTIGATIIVPIEGSDDIIVDANEQGNGASIHLDNDIVSQIQSSVKNSQMLKNLITDSTTIVSAINGQGKLVFYVDASITNKLAKALVTPMSAPTSTEIVCIDDNNSQVNVDLSDELEIENNELKTSELIEKVETIYDMNSNDSSINWGYTSGINGNVTKVFTKKYKKLLIHYQCYFYQNQQQTGGTSNIIELDLTKLVQGYASATKLNLYKKNIGIFETNNTFGIFVEYNPTTGDFGAQFAYDNEWSSDVTNYFAYKIEGVY